jgi:predicted lipid-binding transport protein (Tim44 family)
VFDIDFDIYTIIILAFAVFIFLRLRSVLGQRTGRERRPYDPYSSRDAVRGATNDRVTLPGRNAAETVQKPVEAGEGAERWKGIAEPGSAVAAGLDAIAREDKAFDAKHFVTGARAAYEMIVLAYAEGDRRTLSNLLSREVYPTPADCLAGRPPWRSIGGPARLTPPIALNVRACHQQGLATPQRIAARSKCCDVSAALARRW